MDENKRKNKRKNKQCIKEAKINITRSNYSYDRRLNSRPRCYCLLIFTHFYCLSIKMICDILCQCSIMERRRPYGYKDRLIFMSPI